MNQASVCRVLQSSLHHIDLLFFSFFFFLSVTLETSNFQASCCIHWLSFYCMFLDVCFSKMSHCYFNCDLKACYSLGFIYIASYYSTQVCPVPRCADISHYLCGFRGRRGASEAALQSGWGVLLRVSPQQSWEIHRLHHLGRSAHPKEVSLYAACFTALPQHITSSDLNDWVSWGLRRPHVQDLVFFLSPFCEADCFSFFFLPSFLV